MGRTEFLSLSKKTRVGCWNVSTGKLAEVEGDVEI